MGIDVAGSTRYTYITKKFNCTCADDVFQILSAKDAMTIPMSSEAPMRNSRTDIATFILRV
jgi:hypothetical protein